LRHLGNIVLVKPQQAPRHCHAPREQVLNRRDTHRAAESLKECRAGQRCCFGQLRNRPGPGRTFVHSSNRERETFVGEAAQEAWRRRRALGGSQRFDQQYLQQP
jgi:hypothetical protein